MRRWGSVKLYVSWGFFKFYISIILLVPLCASILGALCIGLRKYQNLKCSLRGFPSYRGLIWFSCGLGWPRWWKFLDIEGQYHFRPFPIKLYIILYHCFNYASEKVNTSPEIEFASFEIGSRKLPAVGKVHSIQTLVDNVVPNEHTKVTATHIYIYMYVCMYVCMYRQIKST